MALRHNKKPYNTIFSAWHVGKHNVGISSYFLNQMTTTKRHSTCFCGYNTPLKKKKRWSTDARLLTASAFLFRVQIPVRLYHLQLLPTQLPSFPLTFIHLTSSCPPHHAATITCHTVLLICISTPPFTT